jgi:D-glycero-alpha-D-manno-heptose-7-phosphate kinase
MIKVCATAPTRVDLAGGTLDLWPLHRLLAKKATVNVAVDLLARVDIEASANKQFQIQSLDQKQEVSGTYAQICDSSALPLIGLTLKELWSDKFPPLKITTSAKSPAGAGLGGSSTLLIALVSAVLKYRELIGEGRPALDDQGLVNLAQDLEAVIIRIPPGCQDYWGAVRGGINAIFFDPGHTRVITRKLSSLPEIGKQLILCYSGKSRASALNNWEIFRRVFEGDQEMLRCLGEIGEVAEKCAQAMLAGDWAKTYGFSKVEWQLRQKLWPSIETPETIKIATAGMKSGALFSRVCGAGGGGVMAIFAPAERRGAVCKALTEAGGQVLEAGICERGVEVTHER